MIKTLLPQDPWSSGLSLRQIALERIRWFVAVWLLGLTVGVVVLGIGIVGGGAS